MFILWAFAACENPWMEEVLETKTITFNSNGGSQVPSQKLYKGETVQRPADPYKSGSIFLGWYVDNETFNDLYDFSFVPRQSMTLHAKWDGEESENLLINSVNVTVTGPLTGETPDTDAQTDGRGYTCGIVAWTPNHNAFEGNTQYTAAVTLTAAGNYTFADQIAAKINGNDAEIIELSVTRITMQYEFPRTPEFTLNEIKIKKQPSKMTYTYGDELDLSDLEAELLYSNGSSITVPQSQFEANIISTVPINGTMLNVPDHNGKPVKVLIGSHSAETNNNLTVNKATPVRNDFEISGSWNQTIGNITPITITRQNGKTTGAITVNYKGAGATTTYTNSTINTAPAGTYAVTFDVAADSNWNAAALDAGTLVIGKTFATGEALAAYLSTMSANTAGNPITVELNISDEAEFQAIKSALDNNPGKYVTLDLSGSTITSIPPNAFYTVSDNTGSPSHTLAGVIIPNTVKNIGNDAFRGCVNLASVTIPSGVTTIGDDAFHGCLKLDKVTIPDTVTSIGKEAFGSCPLTSVVIPSSVNTIGQWAFGSTNLTSVEFKGTISSNSFNNDAFPGDLIVRYKDGGAGTYTRKSGSTLWKPEIFKSIDGLRNWLEAQPNNTPVAPYPIKLDITEIIDPSNGTLDSAVNEVIQASEKFVNLELIGTFSIIGPSSFSDCLYLTSIAIPNGVTSIMNYVFNRCTNLTSIIIPESVTKIGDSEDVFKDCTSLASVTFESADTDISYAYFPYQDSLKTAYDAGGIGTYIRSTTGTNLNTWTKQP